MSYAKYLELAVLKEENFFQIAFEILIENMKLFCIRGIHVI